ncbi:MAG: peptide chain release factor N(5)-glutamine methyltransferase [Bacteroidota bacterium]
MREFIKTTADRLAKVYPDQEAVQMAYLIAEEIFGMRKTHIIAGASRPENAGLINKAEQAIGRLLAGEPIQYIFGKAWFYGREFKCSPSALIPRPETEELIQLIKEKAGNRPGLKILDAGTGTGCIALTLALELNKPEVYAIDISKLALALALDNAETLNAPVNFLQQDILSAELGLGIPGPDIIVSNPPYVTENEKTEMRGNVLEHEPHLALFVSNGHPLVFYEALCRYAVERLKPGGMLFFEINESQGSEMKQLLENSGFINVEIFKDIHARNRMTFAEKPLE